MTSPIKQEPTPVVGSSTRGITGCRRITRFVTNAWKARQSLRHRKGSLLLKVTATRHGLVLYLKSKDEARVDAYFIKCEPSDVTVMRDVAC